MGGVDPGGVVQPFMGWVGNEGAVINWDVSPVSSPVTVSSHRGEFNKAKLEAVSLNVCKLQTLSASTVIQMRNEEINRQN